MENVNLNIDAKTLEQCLKSISNWGETIYQNICTGQSSSVTWGTMDFVGTTILTIFGVTFVLIFVVFLIKVILD